MASMMVAVYARAASWWRESWMEPSWPWNAWRAVAAAFREIQSRLSEVMRGRVVVTVVVIVDGAFPQESLF